MKTTIKNLSKVMLLLVLLLAAYGVKSQNATYHCVAKNDTLWDSKTLRFDIYLSEDPASPADFFLNNYQLSFIIGNYASIKNGGTVTSSYVANSTGLLTEFKPSNMSNAMPEFRLNGPPATTDYDQITTTPVKVGTIQLKNTAVWGQATLNMVPSIAIPPYFTQVQVIDTSTINNPPTLIPNITDSASHTPAFTNPILNKPVTVQNMTGGGNDCTGAGAVVGIDNSELGVMYKLMKGVTQVGADVPGTGSAISFGYKSVGTYTCKAYRKATYLAATMAGSAIVTQPDFTTPTNDGSTIACSALAVTPTLPTVTDACNNVLTPTGPVISSAPACNGTITYTYTYSDLLGHHHDWVYTYTITYLDFSMPQDNGGTVVCANFATAPTLPRVIDNCGNVLTPTGPVIGTVPNCEGDITYTYTYMDCSGNSHDWVYTYHIQYVDFNMPANDGSTTTCAAYTVAPNLPAVTDNCGNVLNPTGPVIGTVPNCEGDITYTYTYTDCASHTHDWVYTYTIRYNDFTMPADAGSTVADINDATVPTPPAVNDNCSNAITPSGPVEGGNYTNGCGTKTYTFTYTDCAGNNHDWVYTYTIISTPVLTASNFNFNRAILHWTNFCPGATQYHVYWRNQAEINSLGALYATVSSPIDTLLIQGLQAGAIYYWKVAPDYGNGWEAYSDSVSFVTPVPTMWVTDITYNRAILRWSGINGAVNYNIKYVTGSITKYRTTNVDTLAINNLSPSSNYSWQIAPDYGDGFGFTTLTKLTVPGSSFTTGIAPAPTLTANPVNFNHAVLSWTPTPGAIKYAVKCFYNNPAINTVPCWTLFPTPGNTSDTIKTLIPGHTYFWEVAPDYGFGWTSFSPLSTFTTPTPVLTAENLSFNREKVYWSGITGAIRYAVRYVKSGVPTVKYTTVDTLILNSLTAGTLYGWQVIPDYGYGYTSYTPSSYFTTSTPSLWIENLNFNQVKAKWSGISGAVKYAVRYYKGGFGVGAPTVRYTLTADSSLMLTSLTQGTYYDWQVNPSYDGLTYTSYSQLSSFTTPIPTLWVDSLKFNQTMAKWSGITGAVKYAVRYYKSGVGVPTIKYTTANSLLLISLTQGTFYDWQVNPSYDGLTYTSYTSLTSFMTPTPVLIVNSTTKTKANLSWTGINGATGFAVKYRKDGTIPYFIKYTGGPDSSITLNGLSSSTLYDWAVNPNYGSGYTSYTLNSNFTTTAVKLINPLLSVTEDMATLSIYPNPATDMVAINFSSNTQGVSNIRVFDIAGNAVIGKTIPTMEGNNTFVLNLNNLSSGMYLLELTNGDKVQTKKIIVQR